MFPSDSFPRLHHRLLLLPRQSRSRRRRMKRHRAPEPEPQANQKSSAYLPPRTAESRMEPRRARPISFCASATPLCEDRSSSALALPRHPTASPGGTKREPVGLPEYYASDRSRGMGRRREFGRIRANPFVGRGITTATNGTLARRRTENLAGQLACILECSDSVPVCARYISLLRSSLFHWSHDKIR
jgi:hypothetical protein